MAAGTALFCTAFNVTQSIIGVPWLNPATESTGFTIHITATSTIALIVIIIIYNAISAFLLLSLHLIIFASHALSVIATNAPTMFPSAPSAIRASICLETYVHPTTFRTVSTVPSSASARFARTGSAW